MLSLVARGWFGESNHRFLNVSLLSKTRSVQEIIVDGWTGGRVDGWTGGRADGWTVERVDACVGGHIRWAGWTGGWVAGCMGEWVAAQFGYVPKQY